MSNVLRCEKRKQEQFGPVIILNTMSLSVTIRTYHWLVFLLRPTPQLIHLSTYTNCFSNLSCLCAWNKMLVRAVV